MITKEQQDEFDRIVECIMTQGDIDCITELISDENKIRFIEDWKKE
jgi:hypothetical protein